MVIRELIKKVASMLNGIDNHIFETHLMIRAALNLSAIDLVLSHDEEVQEDKEKQIIEMAKRRLLGEPCVYIIGNQEFMGIEFLVDKNVLIPRQDTEILVSAVLQHLGENGASILDIGCGSGCVGLSICYHNKRVYTTGVDISPQAIQISEENAKKLGLAERAVFKKADILKDHLAGHYDVLVSNPPYIKEADIKNLQIEVRDFEPHLALSGGEDGLVFYRRITKEAKKLLRTGGLLAYEVGENQAKDVENIMLENGFANIETVKDLCGIDRVVTGIL